MFCRISNILNYENGKHITAGTKLESKLDKQQPTSNNECLPSQLMPQGVYN